MRKALALVALLLPLVAVAETFMFAGGFIQRLGGGGTLVPNVIGEVSAAAAETTLNGVGLILGVETMTCSDEAAGVIVGQNPAEGESVLAGSAVDVVSSDGSPCGGKLSVDIRKRLGL